MLFPIHIGLGPFQLSLHFVCEALAFFLGFRYFLYLRQQQTDPISSPNRMWILIAAAFGAFVGSRLLGVLEEPASFWTSSQPFWHFYYSKTIVGGLLGGLFAVEGAKKIMGETTSSGDLFVYPLVLAMVVGRIGCLSAGIYEPTYGVPTTLPWGMDFGDGQLRHPAPLYEIMALLGFAALLSRYTRSRALENGMQFQYFMVFYLAFRVCAGMWKPSLPVLGPLSSIQLASLLGLLYYRRTVAQLLSWAAKT